ncbi:Ribonuclease H superfamily [Sesbania bispinosa]|nr:Ribonuclease H superfamily [Sesbania bispinosa]
MAEALIFRDEILIANNLSIQRVVLESDSLDLIQTCRKEIPKGEIEHIILVISSLKERFEHCGFTWIGREGKSAVYLAANLAAVDALSKNQPLLPPTGLEINSPQGHESSFVSAACREEGKF